MLDPNMCQRTNITYSAVTSTYKKGQTANAMAQQEVIYRLPVVKLSVQLACADRPLCSQCYCGEMFHSEAGLLTVLLLHMTRHNDNHGQDHRETAGTANSLRPVPFLYHFRPPSLNGSHFLSCY